MSQHPHIARGVVRPVECIAEGWELVRKELPLYIGMVVIMLMGSSLVPFVIQGPLTCGLFMCLARSARGETPSIELFFKGFDKFVPCLIIALIQVGTSIVLAFSFMIVFMMFVFGALAASQGGEPNPVAFVGVFALYPVMFLVLFTAQALFLLAYPTLASQDVDGLTAIRLSAKAVRANAAGIVGLILLTALLALAGMLVCLVGVLVVLPVIYGAHYAAYRRIFGNDLSAFD